MNMKKTIVLIALVALVFVGYFIVKPEQNVIELPSEKITNEFQGTYVDTNNKLNFMSVDKSKSVVTIYIDHGKTKVNGIFKEIAKGEYNVVFDNDVPFNIKVNSTKLMISYRDTSYIFEKTSQQTTEIINE